MTQPIPTSDGQRARRFAGLALLAGAVLWAGWLVYGEGFEGPAPAQPTRAATASAVQVTEPTEPVVTEAIAQATPWEAGGLGFVAEPTAEATMAPEQLRVEESIAVYGPPAGSAFRLSDPVTFYWTWPDPLAEGQQFTVYLRTAAGEQAVGTVAEANLGLAYRLTTALDGIVADPGPAAWRVQLESVEDKRPLARSAERPLMLREIPTG